MNRASSLSAKLVKTGAALLLVALLAMGLALRTSERLDGAAAALNEAGRMRMQAWRMASAAQSDAPRDRMQALTDEFEASLRLIEQGSASRPLKAPWNAETTRDFQDVEHAWTRHRSLLLAADAQGADIEKDTRALIEVIDRFVSAIEHRMDFLASLLRWMQAAMMVFAVAAASVVAYLGYRRVLHPLSRLQQGLRRLEQAPYSEPLPVTSDDEFGMAAQSVNRITSTLQSLRSNMEGLVATKVQPIAAQKERLEALYNISVFLAEASTPQEMSRGFSMRVRELMKADSIVVRWVGDSPEKYLIVGEDRFPLSGQEEERCLRAGACACGSAAAHPGARVIPIHDSDIVALRHCNRLGYRAMVSVPVRMRNRTLGEIDLFFRREIALAREDKDLLEALAQHLAGAAEGMRLAALDREAAVSGERRRIGRELHDSIAQSLAFLKIQAGLLRAAISKNDKPGIDHTLGELGHGLNECTADVRELLLHFRLRAHGDDIETAIEEILLKFRQQAGIEASWRIEGDGLPLDRDVQVQILHVMQEALSNIRKHARASHAMIEIHRGADWLFVIRDDGVGFEAGTDEGLLHIGLDVMRERASVIGATVTVQSRPGQGTTVRLQVPGAFTPYPDAEPQAGKAAS